MNALELTDLAKSAAEAAQDANPSLGATKVIGASPIFFDHNADGIRTATGWIKDDDGFLVLDRNGNGVIDSGRELFGDNTGFAQGPLAGKSGVNGFVALADFEANADGCIDTADAAYSQLLIWRDLDQDGTSQAGELSTLSALGTASIATVATETNANSGDGNTQPWSATYTRSNGGNGSTGQSGTATLASGWTATTSPGDSPTIRRLSWPPQGCPSSAGSDRSV